MSSRLFVHSPEEGRWNATISFCGAVVWAVFATLAGLRRAPFGIIALLFLFAPLVIVPLGLALTRRLCGAGQVSASASMVQLLAAMAVSIAFWLPPGSTAAALSAAWLLVCLFLAADRIVQWRHEPRSSLSFILTLAYLDMLFGAVWLVISRAGIRPMGFQEPIILLTAIHFHYSGFATALIASATLREFHRRNLAMPGLPALIWLVALLPFVLAAGFVFSPLLRFVAATALATCVTALAMVLFWLAAELRNRSARLYLRAASCAAFAAFSLVGLYAVSEYFVKDWITVPGMANSHGVLNGLGFVLLAMLAWLMELREETSDDARQPNTSTANADCGTQPTAAFAWSSASDDARGSGLFASRCPEFVARDFYDR